MKAPSVQKFENASARLQRCVAGKGGFGAEKEYAATYDRLVREGRRPKLRGKYRKS